MRVTDKKLNYCGRIDDQDPEEALDAMARSVVAARADALIVHARKAWLDGLSPRENRDVPPLDYERVYRLKRSFPALTVVLNGGIATIAEAAALIGRVDGVMMGRAAYREPWRLLDVDRELFAQERPAASVRAVADALIPYIERETAAGVRLQAIARHVLGLFHAVPGARAFRRHLAEEAVKPGAGAETFRAALAKIMDGGRNMGDIAA